MKITKLSRRQTQIIIITIGLLLFLITIVYSVKTDIKAVARQMDETLKYVKEQCYIYNRYNEASQTKGLMRAIENAQQVNRNLTYTKDEVTKDKLKTYAEEQKLTGIIILDVNGKVKCEYSTDNLNSRALQNEIQKKTVYWSYLYFSLDSGISDFAAVSVCHVFVLFSDRVQHYEQSEVYRSAELCDASDKG